MRIIYISFLVLFISSLQGIAQQSISWDPEAGSFYGDKQQISNTTGEMVVTFNSFDLPLNQTPGFIMNDLRHAADTFYYIDIVFNHYAILKEPRFNAENEINYITIEDLLVLSMNHLKRM